MKTLLSLLFAALLFGCSSAPIAPKIPPRMAILNDGNVVVGIVDMPCTSKAVKPFIKDEFFSRFKAGRVMFKGRGAIDLCWAPGEAFLDVEPELAGHILVFDADGTYGPIPNKYFFETKENVLDERNLQKPSSI